jgi:hypothetical protein
MRKNRQIGNHRPILTLPREIEAKPAACYWSGFAILIADAQSKRCQSDRRSIIFLVNRASLMRSTIAKAAIFRNVLFRRRRDSIASSRTATTKRCRTRQSS